MRSRRKREEERIYEMEKEGSDHEKRKGEGAEII